MSITVHKSITNITHKKCTLYLYCKGTEIPLIMAFVTGGVWSGFLIAKRLACLTSYLNILDVTRAQWRFLFDEHKVNLAKWMIL